MQGVFLAAQFYTRRIHVLQKAWALLFNGLFLCIYFYIFDLFHFEKYQQQNTSGLAA